MNDAGAQRILAAAIAARRGAYAPYSRFAVGAAILGKDGKLFIGANVENVSYGASMCAERVALFSAVAAGTRTFDTIAIAGPDTLVVTPCGACRQALAEFNSDIKIVYRVNAQIRSVSLSAMLPEAFSPASVASALAGRDAI